MKKGKDNKRIEFELVEEYYYAGQHRFKLRVRETSITINVAAKDLDEAVKSAFRILSESGVLKNLLEN